MALPKNKTLIEVYRKTVTALKRERLTKRESYDEIIIRALKVLRRENGR